MKKKEKIALGTIIFLLVGTALFLIGGTLTGLINWSWFSTPSAYFIYALVGIFVLVLTSFILKWHFLDMGDDDYE